VYVSTSLLESISGVLPITVPESGIEVVHQLQQEIQRLKDELAAFHVEREHQARLATLGTIAGLIAHEFNNVLTPVVSYAQMAIASPDDAVLVQRALERALMGSQRASEIASSILGFVRHERAAELSLDRQERSHASSGENPLSRSEDERVFAFHVEQVATSEFAGSSARGTPTDSKSPSSGSNRCSQNSAVANVGSVMNETLLCMGRDLAQDGITFKSDIPDKLKVAISSVNLQHVLLNLLLNSRKALLGGPSRQRSRREIRMVSRMCAHPISERTLSESVLTQSKAALMMAHTKSNQPMIAIEVSDTGCGMTPEQLERLFQPFASSRVGDSSPLGDDRRRSTGLGMMLCRRLVEDTGGSIAVRSVLGEGTTVRIMLPAAA
jgi:signal transduction histidine kinase